MLFASPYWNLSFMLGECGSGCVGVGWLGCDSVEDDEESEVVLIEMRCLCVYRRGYEGWRCGG